MSARLPWLLTFLILLPAVPCPAAEEGGAAGAGPFPVRMVKLGGSPADPAVREHLQYCVSLGFNAVWVYGSQAGAWTPTSAPDGPYLHPAFLELARWCREHKVRILVSVNPVGATRDTFVFSSRDGEKRIRKFFRMLRRRAGVRDWVLSFDDQPTVLRELNDLLQFGMSAAPAHIDLAARLARATGPRTRLWLCASAYSDVHLGDGSGPYSSAFLRDLHRLPSDVGIVWTGPDVISPEISGADLARTGARLGGRTLLLYDNFGVNDDSRGTGLGLVLSPLRGRDPEIHRHAPVYLACPMTQLGGSRLTLATTAEYLSDPAAYDPDSSSARVLRQLAGDDDAALDALRTQVMEWGGPPHGRNWRHAYVENSVLAATRLYDPAYVSSFTWTRKRYPGRMEALEGLADPAFRRALLEKMALRLAVARAIPLVLEYRARINAGREDALEVLDSIEEQRERVSARPEVLRALDRFLEAAEVRR